MTILWCKKRRKIWLFVQIKYLWRVPKVDGLNSDCTFENWFVGFFCLNNSCLSDIEWFAARGWWNGRDPQSIIKEKTPKRLRYQTMTEMTPRIYPFKNLYCRNVICRYDRPFFLPRMWSSSNRPNNEIYNKDEVEREKKKSVCITYDVHVKSWTSKQHLLGRQ